MENRKDDSKTERVIFPLSKAALAAIDDWRFANHMPSRAAAIRELLRRALDNDNVLEQATEAIPHDQGGIAGFEEVT